MDDDSPPCTICGAEHVGMGTPCYLLIRGSYLFSPVLGCEVFILAPEVGLTPLVLPNGMAAYVVDVRDNSDATRVVHKTCVELATIDLDQPL